MSKPQRRFSTVFIARIRGESRSPVEEKYSNAEKEFKKLWEEAIIKFESMFPKVKVSLGIKLKSESLREMQKENRELS